MAGWHARHGARDRSVAGQLGLRDLHLRLHRPTQRCGDHPSKRAGADRLVALGLPPRRHPGRTGLHLGVLRPVGVGAVRDPGQWRLTDHRAQCPGIAAATGARSGAPDQHRAVGHCGLAACRADPAERAHHQPGRRAVEAVVGGCLVRVTDAGARLRPVRPIGRHHLFHLDPARGLGPGQHRPGDQALRRLCAGHRPAAGPARSIG
ncbi:hypothetical protein D3C81_1548870 [compost metagenome]